MKKLIIIILILANIFTKNIYSNQIYCPENKCHDTKVKPNVYREIRSADKPIPMPPHPGIPEEQKEHCQCNK